jgi:hypothetical protein
MQVGYYSVCPQPLPIENILMKLKTKVESCLYSHTCTKPPVQATPAVGFHHLANLFK